MLWSCGLEKMNGVQRRFPFAGLFYSHMAVCPTVDDEDLQENSRINGWSWASERGAVCSGGQSCFVSPHLKSQTEPQFSLILPHSSTVLSVERQNLQVKTMDLEAHNYIKTSLFPSTDSHRSEKNASSAADAITGDVDQPFWSGSELSL